MLKLAKQKQTLYRLVAIGHVSVMSMFGNLRTIK